VGAISLGWRPDGTRIRRKVTGRTKTRRRGLPARVRDDLVHLGLVDDGRTIRIAEGAEASAGDLIICRRNDHGIEAGEPGRSLANVLRIEAIIPGGIMVRRLLEPDRATGHQRFTDRAFRYADFGSSDLAYAITGHSAQVPLSTPGSRW
jgi:hypothetical protein